MTQGKRTPDFSVFGRNPFLPSQETPWSPETSCRQLVPRNLIFLYNYTSNIYLLLFLILLQDNG
jgi:hypothetical protein